jgi:hypothetical protein
MMHGLANFKFKKVYSAKCPAAPYKVKKPA